MRNRIHSSYGWHLALLCAISLLSIGCGGGKHAARVNVPQAPPLENPPEVVQQIPLNVAPLYIQTGLASWYGPSFNHRRSSNGEIYDMDQLTAAHLTIPLNSVARVTNIATGDSVTVRITDRGPFVADRIIDLSRAAAMRVGVYRHGTAKVRIEVLQSPLPIADGGRWAVQIGAFADSDAAAEMKSKLARRYHSAKVLQFAGPRNDWWVRVRVLNDDKHRAQEVAGENHTEQGGIYLVRLD